MNKKDTLLGLALVFLGIGFLGDTLGNWRLDWFLQSWWVLFILVPGIANMRDYGLRRGNLIGFSVGITLLLVSWFPAFRPFSVSYLLVVMGVIVFFVPGEKN
ncbi:MAG: hypothetical protein FWF59_15515 [Turicibacter sp.]|nr:hypothetical protein [Turicibacter sp.]